MIRFFRKIHLWLSVPFGIFITLICFSGAMLIFEPEITRCVRSDVYYVAEVKDATLDMGEVMQKVQATLPDSVAITGVTVASDKSRTWQVNLSKPRRASVFVDQYTGEITGRYERLGFFSTMFKMHRWLLDSANPHGDGVAVGKLLVGISTLIFVIALITGIVIWWPRARVNFRRSMSIPFSKGWSGFWKGLHVAGGMYALIFVLAMALTGLTWSFDWYRTAFYAVCGVEHTPRNMGGDAPQQAKGGQGKPEGRGEGRGEGKPEGRGEGRGEGKPEGRGEGRGEGKPEGRGEGRGEGKPEGRGQRDGNAVAGQVKESVAKAEAAPAQKAAEEQPVENAAPAEQGERQHHRGEGRPEGRGEGRRGEGRGEGRGERMAESHAAEAAVAEGAPAVAENAAAQSSETAAETAAPAAAAAPAARDNAPAAAAAAERRDRKGNGGARREAMAQTVQSKAETMTVAAADTVAVAADVEEPVSEFAAWQKVYDELSAANPKAPQITVSPGKATVTLSTSGNSRASDRYSFDAENGEVSLASRYADSVEADKLRGWIYSIHTGSLGGMITRIIWLLGALLGASLPLTGYYIWIKHWGKKKGGGAHHA